MEQFAVGLKPRDVAGLAVYDYDEGDPVLLMPYSHAFTTSPMAEGPLAMVLAQAGRGVVTFDPPGAYRSTRRPTMEVAEMVDCALEALDSLGIEGPVDVVGHSVGAFCAAALACSHAERVRRLALISPTGVGDPAKLTALPFKATDSRFWRFYRLAIPVYGGMGTVAQFKAIYDLLVPALHADPSKCPPLVLETWSDRAPAPTRAGRIRGVPKLKHDALATIDAPVLLAVGSGDPIVPLSLAEKVAAWIPRANLVVLEGCGHYPQHEVPEELRDVLAGFLN